MEPLDAQRPPLPKSESVLEDLFWHYVRYTQGGIENCVSQFPIGQFRVDALFDCDGVAVVVELDGKEYHDWQRDDERDSVLLKEVGAVVRIPYRAMKLFPFATMKVLSLWYPRFEMAKDTRTMDSIELQRFYDREVFPLSDDEREDWFYQFNDVIEVWSCSGIDSDSGSVGSPRAFLKQGRSAVITKRNGKTSPELLAALRAEIQKRRLDAE